MPDHDQRYVPAEDWIFFDIERSRQSPLEGFCFEDMADRVLKHGSLVGEPQLEPATVDPSAPIGSRRATFSLAVPPDVGDLLHNGRDGLRARYWLSPQTGFGATHHLLGMLHEMLMSSLPSRLVHGYLVLTNDTVARALQCSSAKIWANEKRLRSDGQCLAVTRWATNETEQGNPRMWRWTPQAIVFDIKSAWITADGVEWIPDNKKDRSKQIHRWGFS